ncbi:MAG: hypothetical protein ACQERD_07450 [Campylobacterota bacterium]
MIVEVASLILVNLLIAVFIGILIGFFLGKAIGGSYSPPVDNTESIDDEGNLTPNAKKSKVNPIFKKNSRLDNKPLILTSPRQSGKDNLKKIKGINVKIEEDLNALGIFHYDQISRWSSKNCDWIEEFLQLPGCVKKYQWVEQARILETGKETVYSQQVEDKEVEVN